MAATKQFCADSVRRTMYSVQEIAARNGVSQQTIYRHARLGWLRFTKIGARSMISVADERAWLARFNDGRAPDGETDAAIDAAFA